MNPFASRIPSFRSWMKRNFNYQQMSDMANHGANTGFPGLIYYSDTTKLYQKYHEDIWDMLYEDSESFGSNHLLELIATFGGAGNVVNRKTFENLLVWYAAEKVALELTEEDE